MALFTKLQMTVHCGAALTYISASWNKKKESEDQCAYTVHTLSKLDEKP